MELHDIANRRRADALTMISLADSGHTGGAMSCMDILTCLYYEIMRIEPQNPDWPERDRFILSKGHCVEGVYAILADLGFFPKEELHTFSQTGSRLIGHSNNQVPGIEICSGALGHGLPIAVGMALGARRTGQSYRTFVLMGDGEQEEGSIWEAAMAGAHYGLDNLYAIVDKNQLQISGATEDVLALGDLAEKWRSFGWDVVETDGHDMSKLSAYFSSLHPVGMPHLLIAHTVKGKGLPFAEGKAEWHHKVPTDQQLEEAYQALSVQGVDWI